MGCLTKFCSGIHAIKRVGQNFEWPGLVGIFAFLSLGFMSLTQGYTFFAFSIVGIGIFFVFLAYYNSYKHKSTELVDRYEERFFVKMKQERKLAAQYLIGKRQSNAQLKCILDFFEAPIADKVISGQIDAKQVYNYFHHWIMLYWEASQNDINSYRKKDPGAWKSFKALYDIMIAIEIKEVGEQYINWDLERLKEALEDEASLF